jgi:hypothetical protein
MGNFLSLCFRKSKADHEEAKLSGNMAKDAVYQTTPFEGQKPGTSGTSTDKCMCLTCRIEEEGQGVYAEELHRELRAG